MGFKPLPAFPEFQRTYESSELFPLFQNRVLDPGRKDFAAYLASLDLPGGVLVELTGTLPPGLQPMSSDEFQPLVQQIKH